MRKWWRLLALAQGGYFAFTGLWPIIDINSFMAVTGPKTDLWLVKTFGALVCIPAAILLWSAATGRRAAALVISGIGSALVLGACDLIYVAQGVIDKIYLLDAAAEVAFIIAWCAVLRHPKPPVATPPEQPLVASPPHALPADHPGPAPAQSPPSNTTRPEAINSPAPSAAGRSADTSRTSAAGRRAAPPPRSDPGPSPRCDPPTAPCSTGAPPPGTSARA